MSAVDGIVAFVERRGDRGAEVIWAAVLTLVSQAADDARDVARSRWRHHPKGELRRLRSDLEEALELAELAVALQEEERVRGADLAAELQNAAVEAGKQRRRAQTLPAERARLEKAARRRQGLPAVSDDQAEALRRARPRRFLDAAPHPRDHLCECEQCVAYWRGVGDQLPVKGGEPTSRTSGPPLPSLRSAGSLLLPKP